MREPVFVPDTAPIDDEDLPVARRCFWCESPIRTDPLHVVPTSLIGLAFCSTECERQHDEAAAREVQANAAHPGRLFMEPYR